MTREFEIFGIKMEVEIDLDSFDGDRTVDILGTVIDDQDILDLLNDRTVDEINYQVCNYLQLEHFLAKYEDYNAA